MVLQETKAHSYLLQTNDREPKKIFVMLKNLSGYVVLQDVKITCIPRDSDFVKEYFPSLPAIDMQLDNT